MPNVAFCRPLKKGMSGGDVVAHKRAISRWNPALYPWDDFTDYFGPRFEEAIKVFQQQYGILATGRIGSKTHEALEVARRKGTTEAAFDQLSVRLAKDFCAKYTQQTVETNKRTRIVDAGFFWYGHRASIRYSQARPFQQGKPPWYPSQWDCSAFVTNCYYAAGMPDPNRLSYSQYGFTGTLSQNGQPVNMLNARPGDLFFYGHPIGHVAVYVGEGMVLSLGSYPMGYYRWNYRTDFNHARSYI